MIYYFHITTVQKGRFSMKYNGDAKRIKAKVTPAKPVGESSDLFTDEPVKTPWEKEAEKEAARNALEPEENPLDYEPAPETEMDFMTEDEEKTRRKNIIIGAVIGLLLAALLIGGYIYHNQSGKIKGADVSTTATTSETQKYGSLEPTQNTTRTYKTPQLTVHKDEKGVWRSYAGLEKTVGYTGVVGNDTGWWYIENDVVNFKYNGIASNDFGDWLIENGKVASKFTGNYVYNGKMYRIQEGKVVGTEPLTNKATTSTTAKPTSANAAVPVTASPANTTAEATTAHEHHWIAIYDGDAIVQTGIRTGSACKCPDCGLIFANAALLESHVYSTEGHQAIKYDKDGGLDSMYIVSKDEVGNSDVIIEYTNGAVKYRCTVCGKETTNADETDFIQ